MRHTFLNNNNEGNLKRIGLESLEKTKEAMEAFMEDPEDNEDYGSFYEYGLALDVVEDEDTQDIDYIRYQMSWGGPSDEVRFHTDGLIEYVYMDWSCGVGFDISRQDWAIWLKDMLMIEEMETQHELAL